MLSAEVEENISGGTHKTYSVNEQPRLQKQIISSMANVQ